MSLSQSPTTGKTEELRRQSSRRSSINKVPNAKKPKSRPPQSLRDKFPFILQSHLPTYSGPYNVGIMDIEVPVDNPRTFSHISREGHPLLRLETVLFSLYYPAAIGSGARKDPTGKKWSRETWLPRPRMKTAQGYGKFAGIGDAAIPLFAATTMLTKIPALRNAPPANHWPPPRDSMYGGFKVKNEQGSAPPGESKEPMLPLLFFSHGLGGSRTAYSTICGEFASYGFVVCALEHRDGSGARTFVNHPKEGVGSMEEREAHSNLNHYEDEQRRGYDVVDYIFPKHNPMDTSPSNEEGVDSELRSAQIEMRLAEIEEAYRIMRCIREGDGESISQKNLRREGYVGSSSRGLKGIDWYLWKNRFHCERCTVAGHSFGAATVVEILRNTADRFTHVEQGIIYDIWGAPVKPPAENKRHRIHRPILGINSEAFMYWRSNFDAVMSLMEEARGQGAPAFLCTVRGSVHITQSDFAILYPHLCSFFLKATVNPRRAVDLNISASLEFLRDVMGEEGGGKAIIKRCMTDEELLGEDVLENIPDEHRPKSADMAEKLKIPHEFRTRLLATMQRKLKRKPARKGPKRGGEVWMHFGTPENDVSVFVEQRRVTEGEAKKEADEEPVDDSDQGETDYESNESQETWLGRRRSWKDTAS
ncbi:hypothetical protein GQ43DRAFT_437122 [Delitschia confertaspora ATCC 74209]|uniref:1-alkyl-2-acetylglycerophosphocholine esterase n=1 Tax=Delitschia confertaspora ATCC 74209 TaxID=1513339 RepID=A0A9P4JUF0_9PLEO|nr:hypothetical protein GQ43DRAFT_437122 [Delitschia confertaspora ATCC 74209]